MLIVQIMVAKPAHIVPREHIAGPVFLFRMGLGKKIGGGIDQQLEVQRGASLVSRHLRHDRRQVAAGAITPDSYACGVNIQLGPMSSDPLRRGIAIVGSSRKLVFGSQPIIYRYHDTASFVRQAAAEGIVCIQVANHPATAMKEHERRKGTFSLWGINSDRQIALWTRDQPIFDACNRFDLTRCKRSVGLHRDHLAYHLRFKRMKRRPIEGGHLLQIRLYLWIEWHTLNLLFSISSMQNWSEAVQKVFHPHYMVEGCQKSMRGKDKSRASQKWSFHVERLASEPHEGRVLRAGCSPHAAPSPHHERRRRERSEHTATFEKL